MTHLPSRLSVAENPLNVTPMTGVRAGTSGSGMPRGGSLFRRWWGIVACLAAGVCLSGWVDPRLKAEPLPKFRPVQHSPASRDREVLPPENLPDELPDRKKPSLGLSRNPEVEDIREPLAAIEIEGNNTIFREEIAAKIKTRAGRVPDPKQIRDDVKALYATRWFFSVETRVKQSPQGPVLVFKVLERPIINKVEYKGNKKLKTKELAALTNIKVGGAYDVGSNRESANRIESHYHEKGFVYAQVELERGASADDREVIFKITEGPKVHVSKINFTGNKAISNGILKTQAKTKTRLFWLFGGKYDPATIPEDVSALKEYYHSLGYFDVRIKSEVGVSKDKSQVQLTYDISEGMRYKVRNIEYAGNRVIEDDKLRANSRLKPHDFFNERMLNADVEKMTNQYGELGRIFARVEATPRYLEEPGVVDLVYNINEDRPYRIGRVHVHIEGEHPHTKESVVLTNLQFRPGELASREKIKKSEQKLRSTQVFAGPMPGSPEGPRISLTPTELPPDTQLANVVRGQNYSEDIPPNSPAFDPNQSSLGAPPGMIFQEQAPGFVDPHIYVGETQTGRLMFGVGVNSNAGVVGSIVLEENNFDLFRGPSSFQDIADGTAWRGGGQQFRIEAVPGSQVSRYLMSWRDPHFLEQDVSFGVSGFYYQRFFPNWNEQRLGGRITLGRQFTPEWSATAALRLEDVVLKNPSFPTPPSLAAAVGDNFLSTARVGIAHDTRDSAFLPGKGHFMEVSYEQGFGEFVYPRLEADARQYFTVWERPDGRNRNIISVGGNIGWTDNGTPIFEKFYAGGFQSFRGFQFYGVTPREFGVRVGGRFQALGSVEYLLPLTADDTIQVVGFSDFGTVENRVAFDDFRLSVGAGLRLTVPAMGPVPIALDFGVPIIKQGFDSTQLFSFYVGVLR